MRVKGKKIESESKRERDSIIGEKKKHKKNEGKEGTKDHQGRFRTTKMEKWRGLCAPCHLWCTAVPFFFFFTNTSK